MFFLIHYFISVTIFSKVIFLWKHAWNLLQHFYFFLNSSYGSLKLMIFVYLFRESLETNFLNKIFYLIISPIKAIWGRDSLHTLENWYDVLMFVIEFLRILCKIIYYMCDISPCFAFYLRRNLRRLSTVLSEKIYEFFKLFIWPIIYTFWSVLVPLIYVFYLIQS